eukprot:12884886-Prorocentrum_lima.AAC.1
MVVFVGSRYGGDRAPYAEMAFIDLFPAFFFGDTGSSRQVAANDNSIYKIGPVVDSAAEEEEE